MDKRSRPCNIHFLPHFQKAKEPRNEQTGIARACASTYHTINRGTKVNMTRAKFEAKVLISHSNNFFLINFEED
jgi:hypothetical protein